MRTRRDFWPVVLMLAIFALVVSALNAGAGWNEQGAWKGQARSRSVAMQIDAVATAATVANNKAAFTVPTWMDNWRLTDAQPRVYTRGSGTGTLDVTVAKRTSTSDATMYSATVKTDYTRATGTLTSANERVAAGDMVIVNVTRIHGTASSGLWVTLNFMP